MSIECFNNHKTNKICQTYKYCKKCRKLYNKTHECGKKKCAICKLIVPLSFHHCFVNPNKKDEIELSDNIPKVFVFYDFETFIETDDNDNSKLHRANLCCINVVCDYCWDQKSRKKNMKYCAFCGADEKVFNGFDCVENFLKFLFNDLHDRLRIKKKTMKLKSDINVKVIAHNSRAYDVHFIMKYIIDNNVIPQNIIQKGTKIFAMKIKNMNFIDSVSFLPMPLKQLPKTFGINEKVKGYFPHLFNLPENWPKIISKLPDESYYQPELMKINERAAFYNWYSENKNMEFDFQKEIIKYCQNDVNILMESVMIFRDIWKEYFNIDCLTRNITIAQAVMEVYKTNYLKPKQIAIIPRFGYDNRRRQSYIANAYLDYMQTNRDHTILREYRVNGYNVDGFIPESKEIFEFYGCYFHGCIKCYPGNRMQTFNSVNGECMEELYKRTINREKTFANEFRFTKIWECELKIFRKSSKEIDEFFINHRRKSISRKFVPALEPRDAFFGGRVNANKLYHEIGENEKIYYYDFTSLYPFVCKVENFPLGHPKVIIDIYNTDINPYFGLISCMILPPTNLYFPILPMRLNSKLYFTLCYTCALNSEDKCTHNDQDRALTGVWTTPELNTAIQFGYVIIRIYEIWHFENTIQYSKNTTGLFSEFINTCIKGKIEASGWPSNCFSEDDKENYVRKYAEREGINLDKSKIENNPGKRNTFKLAVNSFWGKFGQNSFKMNKTEIITCPEKFFALLSDNTLQVDDAYLISDHILKVKYNSKEDYKEESNSSNVVIAAFVTSYARLRLFNLINKLNNKCLYYDTDSVIFVAKDGDDIPKNGDIFRRVN